MPDPKLDLIRVSREALEALARDVLDNPEWGSSTVSRIRAEAAAPDHDADCYSLLGDGCDCGAEPAAEPEDPTANPRHPSTKLDLSRAVAMIEEWTHQHGAALCPKGADTYGEGMRDAKRQVAGILSRIRAEAMATLCYEGDCAKMTGRARPCPIHDAPTPRAELTGEERDLKRIEAVLASCDENAPAWRMWEALNRIRGIARRAAARKEGKT